MMIYNHTHVFIVQLVDIHFMIYVVKIGYITDENCTYETGMYKNTLQQHIKKYWQCLWEIEIHNF